MSFLEYFNGTLSKNSEQISGQSKKWIKKIHIFYELLSTNNMIVEKCIIINYIHINWLVVSMQYANNI